jgi:hypothetical protein
LLSGILSSEWLPARTNNIFFHDTSSDSEHIVDGSLPGLTVSTENDLASLIESDISVYGIAFSVLRVDRSLGDPRSSVFVSGFNASSPVNLVVSINSPNVTITTNIELEHVLVMWEDFSPELFGLDMDKLRGT